MYSQLLVVLIALAPLACGGVTVQQPKGETCNQDGCQTNTDQSTGSGTGTAVGATNEAAAPATPVQPTATTTTDVSVTVKVHVATATGTSGGAVTAQPAATDGEPIYDPRTYTWPAAQAAAPAGYRMATRAEVTDLLDEGALAAYHHADVWTATTDSATGDHYFVDLDNSQADPTADNMPMSALYVVTK